MGSIDSVTWQALALVLTLAGILATVLVWRARGAVAGLRMLGFSLLPAAAYLTGTLRLLWEVGDAVAGWAVRLVLSPTVWVGLALAVVSVVLLVVTSWLGRRGRVARPGREPELSAGRANRPARDPVDAPPGDDLADIEAILKRHGIS